MIATLALFAAVATSAAFAYPDEAFGVNGYSGCGTGIVNSVSGLNNGVLNGGLYDSGVVASPVIRSSVVVPSAVSTLGSALVGPSAFGSGIVGPSTFGSSVVAPSIVSTLGSAVVGPTTFGSSVVGPSAVSTLGPFIRGTPAVAGSVVSPSCDLSGVTSPIAPAVATPSVVASYRPTYTSAVVTQRRCCNGVRGLISSTC